MKKLSCIILVAALVVFALADIIHEFIANDTFHYFSDQPHRLVLAAAIGIFGGLVALYFSRLSPRLKRKTKLVALGSAASLVTLVGSYFVFRFASLSLQAGSAIPRHMTFVLSLCTVAIAGLLWFEFYQVFKKQGVMTP